MREPLPQPLMIDGAQTFVRNASLVLDALGFRGLIVMWSGAIAEIPPGWALCDGRQGTPDLRDRFMVGARVDVDAVAMCLLTDTPTQSGGSLAHTHMFKTNGHTHLTKSGGPFDGSIGGLDVAPAKDTGTTDAPSTVPVPYFALAFIMKV